MPAVKSYKYTEYCSYIVTLPCLVRYYKFGQGHTFLDFCDTFVITPLNCINKNKKAKTKNSKDKMFILLLFVHLLIHPLGTIKS